MFKYSLVLFSLILGLFSEVSFSANNNNWIGNAEEEEDGLAWMQAHAVPVNNDQRFGRLGPPQIRIERWQAAAEVLLADPALNETPAHATRGYAFVLVRDPENPQAFIQSIRDEGGQEVHHVAYVAAPAAVIEQQNNNQVNNNQVQAAIEETGLLGANDADANNAAVLDGTAPA